MCAMKHLAVFLMLAAVGAMGAETARRGVHLRVDPDAVAEILPLAVKAVDIFKRASAREARHARAVMGPAFNAAVVNLIFLQLVHMESIPHDTNKVIPFGG